MSRVLQIRDFPDDLRRKLKIIAAQTDKPLRSVIIEILEDYIKSKESKKGKQ